MITANGVVWTPQDVSQKTEQVALLDSYVEGLRLLAPDMGAYMNEVRLGLGCHAAGHMKYRSNMSLSKGRCL